MIHASRFVPIRLCIAALAMLAPLAAAEKEEWQNLQDPRPINQMVADYEAWIAQKITIDPADDEASKALAATLKWSVAIIGWKEGVANSFQAGSGEVIWNDPLHGTGILTAKHVLTDVDGVPWARMAVITSPDLFTAGIAGEWIEMDMSKKVEHPTQDLAVLQLPGELLDEDDEAIEPVTFYDETVMGPLKRDDIVLMGGYGRTGPPSVAGPGPVGTFDGYRRVARNLFERFSSITPNVVRLQFDSERNRSRGQTSIKTG